MTGLHSTIGTMLISRSSLSYKNWLMAMPMMLIGLQSLMVLTASFISHMMIKSAGKIVYDADHLHKVTFVAKSSFWYLDSSHQIANANQNSGFEARRLLTRNNNDVNVIIPLNRYSFFEKLNDNMLVPMELQFNMQLQNDDELIPKADAAADGRVVINRFLLWVPKVTPKDSLYNRFVNHFLKESKWTYLREMY